MATRRSVRRLSIIEGLSYRSDIAIVGGETASREHEVVRLWHPHAPSLSHEFLDGEDKANMVHSLLSRRSRQSPAAPAMPLRSARRVICLRGQLIGGTPSKFPVIRFLISSSISGGSNTAGWSSASSRMS